MANSVSNGSSVIFENDVSINYLRTYVISLDRGEDRKATTYRRDDEGEERSNTLTST